MDHIGIDVHKKESQLCILGEDGQLREPRIRTTPERFTAVLGDRPRARILLEASTESEWVARCLEGLGHDEERPCPPWTGPTWHPAASGLSHERRAAAVVRGLPRGARLV
jgi:hypothetical protein